MRASGPNKRYGIKPTAEVPRDQLNYLEALAAQRIAEKHPGGPRSVLAVITPLKVILCRDLDGSLEGKADRRSP